MVVEGSKSSAVLCMKRALWLRDPNVHPLTMAGFCGDSAIAQQQHAAARTIAPKFAAAARAARRPYKVAIHACT